MMNELMPVLSAILKDNEFLDGGIFSKEDYYMDKYNLTITEMSNIQTCLYYALNIKDECYNRRISNICKTDYI